MRVIAGKYRGRALQCLKGNAIRPTPDRVKESLFQILEPRLRGAYVLDLFCGSGALGTEALSRGAKAAVFNDASKESIALASKNLSFVAETVRFSVLDFRVCLARGGEFDIIFADPPYREDLAAEIQTLAVRSSAIKRGGLLVYESEREEEPQAGWTLFDRRSYGRTKITMLERSDP